METNLYDLLKSNYYKNRYDKLEETSIDYIDDSDNFVDQD